MPRKLEEPRSGEVSKTTEAWRKTTMDQATATTLMCIIASFTIVGKLIHRNNHHDWENLQATITETFLKIYEKSMLQRIIFEPVQEDTTMKILHIFTETISCQLISITIEAIWKTIRKQQRKTQESEQAEKQEKELRNLTETATELMNLQKELQ